MTDWAGTILVVDDDPFSCKLARELLTRERYVVVVAYSGQAALDVLATTLPDLILLDALMPQIDGFELARRLKSNDRTRNIPIIMVTGTPDNRDRLKALESGVEEFLLKPVQAAELKVRVRNLLRLKKYQDALAEQRGVLQGELAERGERLGELEQQLVLSEKMASIGQLAAGVAHELNNPIGFVNSNLGTLQKYVGCFVDALRLYAGLETHLPMADVAALAAFKKKSDLGYAMEDVDSLLAESLDGLARVRKIVQDLKDFSRSDTSQEWQEADLHRGLDSTLAIVNNEIKYKADVIKAYGELPLVECLPSQINQVFLNLLVNAAQAIPGERRGVITIRSGLQGDKAWVEIADTGTGIAPEHLGRIFDPFFTTKPVGFGTGLGLSVSYGIVRRHGGAIDVSSVLHRGSVFRVLLPIHQSSRGAI